MLILSRKETEQIVITTRSGEVIELTAIEIGRHGRRSMRIGIECDKDIRIVRKELLTGPLDAGPEAA